MNYTAYIGGTVASSLNCGTTCLRRRRRRRTFKQSRKTVFLTTNHGTFHEAQETHFLCVWHFLMSEGWCWQFDRTNRSRGLAWNGGVGLGGGHFVEIMSGRAQKVRQSFLEINGPCLCFIQFIMNMRRSRGHRRRVLGKKAEEEGFR